MNQKISLLDTTLRDGEQGEGINFTLEDKLKITTLLDSLEIHYIEGGWPGANPKAGDYFKAAGALPINAAKITAFGSTRHPKNTAETDPNLLALIDADPDVFVIFGKTWDFHVTEALKITLEENLTLIEESIHHLKTTQKELIYDAEHFFDGYKADPNYALKTLESAKAGGADILCLCDTNGGTLPEEVEEITKIVIKKLSHPIGIHTHNDSGLAVANTIAALKAGATHVQGTLNGYGERCGNAGLSTIIALLKTKYNNNCITDTALKRLSHTSNSIDEIANLTPNIQQPFVGKSAFAHKGGIHVSAILKNPETYEHINPETVGNTQRVLLSELSGASNLRYKAHEYGLEITEESTKALLEDIKELENKGYQFEGAEASFILRIKKSLGRYKEKIQIHNIDTTHERQNANKIQVSATIKLTINGKEKKSTGTGNGPVSAIDHALRAAIEPVFPVLNQVKLTDYKVRVLNSHDSTDAKVRVLITSSDGKKSWQTIGVSSNIIEASWRALLDSYETKLLETNND